VGFDWAALSASAAFTAALLGIAAFTFNRMEKGFADVV
jgi:ABC-type polysaccharide/polyol phosphate export permease